MECTVQKTDTRDDKVSKIIDKVLNQVFGKEATTLIYRHLERNYSVKRNEIGDRIEVFAKGLEDFLRSGAYAIERKILEDIYSSYGLLRRMELEKTENECDFVSQMKLFMRKA
jgi:hypothetical protein